jgi:hypothetical protein
MFSSSNYGKYLVRAANFFFSAKHLSSTVLNVIHFLRLHFFTTQKRAKELGFWYLLLFCSKGVSIFRKNFLRRRRKYKTKAIIKKKKTRLFATINSRSFIFLLFEVEKQLLLLKNPKHVKLYSFSHHGVQAVSLTQCETYKVVRTTLLQKFSKFFINDMGLAFRLAIFNKNQYLCPFFLSSLQLNQTLNQPAAQQKFFSLIYYKAKFRRHVNC